jgi:hypothetical protein
MPLRSLSFLSSAWRPSKAKTASRVESRPPVAARAVGTGSGWRSWLGSDRRLRSLDAARLEFAGALFDIHTAEAGRVLDRIAIARSPHELWHLREEIFSLVSRRHDQAEAASRLVALDRHFPKRSHAQAARAD